jgi:hypothetical protein
MKKDICWLKPLLKHSLLEYKIIELSPPTPN